MGYANGDQAVTGKAGIMAAANKEYHELLDDLAGRGFFGELVLYFQRGNVESSRLIERNTKKEVRDKMQARKRPEAAATSRPAGRPFRA